MSDAQINVIEGDQAQVVLAPGENPAIVASIPGPQGPAGAVAAAIDGSAALPSIAFASDTDTGLYRVGANQLGVSTGGTQRLIIDANGQIEATSLGTAAAPTWTFVGDPDTGAYSPGANQFAVSTGGTGRLFVDASGNVGVGITPANNFHVSGGALTRILVSSTSAGARTDIAFRNSASVVTSVIGFDGTNNEYDYRSGDLVFRYVGSERLRITSSGNVGVGTSTVDAAYLLQVNGAIGSVSAFGNFTALESSGGTGFRWTLANNGTFRLQRTTNGFSAVTTPIFIDSSDRVGIGTTSPDYTLNVQGTVGVGKVGASGAYNLFWAPNTSGQSVRWIRNNAGELSIGEGLTAGTNEHLRIDPSGRLLVGTSSSVTGASIEAISSSTVRRPANPAELGLWRSNGTLASPTPVSDSDILGRLYVVGYDGTNYINAARIEVAVDGTPGANDMPGRLVFSTTADGAASPTERLRITSAGVLQVADAGNIAVGTTTGTKIGTATTQKLGFYNKTPVVQPAAVADATDAASAITQLNALLARMRDLGLIAT